MQPTADSFAARARPLRLAALALALAGCSASRREGPNPDSVTAATHREMSTTATAVVAPAPAPLAHDSVVVALADTGVRTAADGHLLLPLVFAATCQGEDCETAFTGLACEGVELRAAPDTAAPIVARVAKGDSVHVRRTDLHVLSPGVVVVKESFVLTSDANDEDNRPLPRKDTLQLAAGDTVYLLHYEMLGSWLYRWKGKTTEGSEFWGGPFADDALGEASHDTSRAVARSQPVSEQWWLLDDGARPLGWWRVDSAASMRSKRDMDYWGDHCPGWHAPPAQ